MARRIYLRARRRAKRRKKIRLTQWNPATVKKCVVKGYLPLLICGTGTTGTTYRNYGSHMHDYKKYDPFGGGISTMQFNLSILFDEYMKHRNSWSKSNVDLELIRYRGCTFKLYRHPTCDFFFTYTRKPPFKDSQLTGPSLHPGMLMNRRKKIVLPSFKTKPKGRTTKTIRIPPPTLFADKWYFQRDFAKVPLVNIGASIGNLRFPFCRPQTENTCVYFQVLSNPWNNMLSIQHPHTEQNWNYIMDNLINRHWHEDQKKGTMGNYDSRDRTGVVFNTFKTEEHIKDPNFKDYKETITTPYTYDTVTSLWGDYVYKHEIIQAFKNNAEKYYNSRKGTQVTASKYLNHKTGIFSPIFLSRQRLAPDFTGFYTEVIYNPANDKGVGNKIWMDWCTKNDSQWTNRDSIVPVQDLPLWAAIMGYSDYCKKYFQGTNVLKEARLTIICPYTEPPLTDKNSTDTGFIPFDYNFGDGKMPDGQNYIPVEYRFRWYPCMFHQQNWMNDIAQCGPFAYDGGEKSAVLTAKYKFTFLLGGNPIAQQTLKDPGTQPTFEIPGGGGLPPRVQVENPKRLHEGMFFRAWDIRRGYFGEKALKRMSEQQITSEFITGPPKRSKFEVPAIAADDCGSQGRKEKFWYESSETQSQTTETEEEETEQESTQLQLRKQLKEQKQLKCQVQHLIQQLIKTQHHLHVPIIP